MGLKSNEEVPAKVKSAIRTLEVLEFLASRNGIPARLVDLSEKLGAPRSSTHALLRTLSEAGWVRTDSSGTLYTLGVRSLLVGTSILDTDPYIRVVRPVLSDLRDEYDETFHLGRVDGNQVVYLATFENQREIRPFTRVGRSMPAHCSALGKALLAARADFPKGPLQALTPNTITDPQALHDELAAVAARGYAFDNEENTVGLSCVAVALHYGTLVTDAISCSVPTNRMTEELRERLRLSLLAAASRIEESAPLQGVL